MSDTTKQIDSAPPEIQNMRRAFVSWLGQPGPGPGVMGQTGSTGSQPQNRFIGASQFANPNAPFPNTAGGGASGPVGTNPVTGQPPGTGPFPPSPQPPGAGPGPSPIPNPGQPAPVPQPGPAPAPKPPEFTDIQLPPKSKTPSFFSSLTDRTTPGGFTMPPGYTPGPDGAVPGGGFGGFDPSKPPPGYDPRAWQMTARDGSQGIAYMRPDGTTGWAANWYDPNLIAAMNANRAASGMPATEGGMWLNGQRVGSQAEFEAIRAGMPPLPTNEPGVTVLGFGPGTRPFDVHGEGAPLSGPIRDTSFQNPGTVVPPDITGGPAPTHPPAPPTGIIDPRTGRPAPAPGDVSTFMSSVLSGPVSGGAAPGLEVIGGPAPIGRPSSPTGIVDPRTGQVHSAVGDSGTMPTNSPPVPTFPPIELPPIMGPIDLPPYRPNDPTNPGNPINYPIPGGNVPPGAGGPVAPGGPSGQGPGPEYVAGGPPDPDSFMRMVAQLPPEMQRIVLGNPAMIDQLRQATEKFTAPQTQSVDQLGGENSAFFRNMMNQLSPAFNQRRDLALAAAKESAGTLTGSGFANTLGNSVNRSLAEERASLADYASRGVQTEVQRQLAQGGLDLSAMEMGQRAELSNIATEMQRRGYNADQINKTILAQAGLDSQQINTMYTAALANNQFNAQQFLQGLMGVLGIRNDVAVQGGAGSFISQLLAALPYAAAAL